VRLAVHEILRTDQSKVFREMLLDFHEKSTLCLTRIVTSWRL
jgi:hypothetical protein